MSGDPGEPYEGRPLPEALTIGMGSTVDLLGRARRGDRDAIEILAARYMPALKRFAHGRLPAGTRTVFDTDDLVQVSILRALDRLDEFSDRGPGSLLAYLRQIVLNRIRDESRRHARAPRMVELGDQLPDPQPSPLERTIGLDAIEHYERALAELPADAQEALMMRLEMGCSYREIATALGRPGPHAARLATSRALLKLVHRLRALRNGA
jgi:RNA polymerase sigma-70 factor (ECF subfamily)